MKTTPTNKQKNWITIWLASGCFWLALLVLVGGLTRLNEAGLSITEWEVISGVIPPLTAEQWEDAFDKYREIPEYQELRAGMSMDEFKTIYWWEWSHRMLARGLGILFIVPFGFFWWKGWLSRRLILNLWAIVALGLLQGLAGWYLVRSGLADQPYVTPWRLSLHLGMGFLIFGLLWRLVLQQTMTNSLRTSSGIPLWLRYTAAFLPVLILVQVMVGGLVSGLQAGYVYPTFPDMGGYWIPPEIGLHGAFWTDVLNNAITAQWVHRTLGWLLAILTIVLFAGFLMQKTRNVNVTSWSLALLVTIVVQIALGFWVMLAGVPDALASVHQMVALIALAAAIGVTKAVYPSRRLPAGKGKLDE